MPVIIKQFFQLICFRVNTIRFLFQKKERTLIEVQRLIGAGQDFAFCFTQKRRRNLFTLQAGNVLFELRIAVELKGFTGNRYRRELLILILFQLQSIPGDDTCGICGEVISLLYPTEQGTCLLSRQRQEFLHEAGPGTTINLFRPHIKGSARQTGKPYIQRTMINQHASPFKVVIAIFSQSDFLNFDKPNRQINSVVA